MTTIKEIAKLANVSAVTVSNVLNGKGGASEAKARQIRDLAQNLHYTPNKIAKNLKRQRTNTIGIITEDLTVFNTPEIVDGIDSYCEAHGFDIIMGNLRLFKLYNNDFTDTEKHKKLFDQMVDSMLSKQVEGIIYVGYHCRSITYLPEKRAVPFVYAYCFAEDKTLPSVIYDDEKAAFDATSLLIQKGHTRIGAIGGPYSSFHTQERLQGYQRALFENNILYDNRIVQFGNWGRDCGYELGEKIIENGATAIFSFNDEMASGVFDYCADRGLTVGRDIALIGFDNREISLAFRPQLTTVAPPLNDIGEASARIVIDEIRGEENPEKHLKMPCTLIERGSTETI